MDKNIRLIYFSTEAPGGGASEEIEDLLPSESPKTPKKKTETVDTRNVDDLFHELSTKFTSEEHLDGLVGEDVSPELRAKIRDARDNLVLTTLEDARKIIGHKAVDYIKPRITSRLKRELSKMAETMVSEYEAKQLAAMNFEDGTKVEVPPTQASGLVEIVPVANKRPSVKELLGDNIQSVYALMKEAGIPINTRTGEALEGDISPEVRADTFLTLMFERYPVLASFDSQLKQAKSPKIVYSGKTDSFTLFDENGVTLAMAERVKNPEAEVAAHAAIEQGESREKQLPRNSVTVKPGDSPLRILGQEGYSRSDLDMFYALNPKNGRKLRAGQSVQLPSPENVAKYEASLPPKEALAAKSEKVENAAQEEDTVTVQPGDSVSKILRKNGLAGKYEEFYTLNGKKTLRPGQEIKLPTPRNMARIEYADIDLFENMEDVFGAGYRNPEQKDDGPMLAGL